MANLVSVADTCLSEGEPLLLLPKVPAFAGRDRDDLSDDETCISFRIQILQQS